MSLMARILRFIAFLPVKAAEERRKEANTVKRGVEESEKRVRAGTAEVERRSDNLRKLMDEALGGLRDEE